MLEFYNNLWNKEMGKLEALRAAQLTMIGGYDPEQKLLSVERGLKLIPDSPKQEIEKTDRLPPFFWAAFVLSGDWR